MLGQVSFRGLHNQRYVLMRRTSFEPPWPPSARFEQLAPSASIRILQALVCNEYGSTRGRVLELLEIRQHPSNLADRELTQLLCAAMENHVRRFTLYRELPQPRSCAIVDGDRAASAPVLSTGTRELDFFAFDLVDEDGHAIANIPFVIAFADGDHRTLTTDSAGQVRVERVPTGSCEAKLSKQTILFSDDDFADVDPTGELREQDAKLRAEADKQHGKR